MDHRAASKPRSVRQPRATPAGETLAPRLKQSRLDLLPVLLGQEPAQARTLYWDCGFQWAIRSGDWKLAHVTTGSTSAGIRSVEHADPGAGARLFDLRRDPGEQEDLASRRPDVVRELSDAHHSWRATTGLADLDRAEAAAWG